MSAAASTVRQTVPRLPEPSRRQLTRRLDARDFASATMAHHYPPHAQAPGYPSYPAAAPAASYSYPAGYYPGYSPRPGASGYAFDPAAAGASAYAQGGPPTAPEIPGVSAQLASQALQRLISVEMRDAGFESAEGGALRRLELEVASCEFPLTYECR